jgi:hypothetical protein
VVVGWWVDAPCPEDDVDLRLVFRVGVAGGEVRRDGPPSSLMNPVTCWTDSRHDTQLCVRTVRSSRESGIR